MPAERKLLAVRALHFLTLGVKLLGCLLPGQIALTHLNAPDTQTAKTAAFIEVLTPADDCQHLAERLGACGSSARILHGVLLKTLFTDSTMISHKVAKVHQIY